MKCLNHSGDAGWFSRVRVKPGVELTPLKPEIRIALKVLFDLYEDLGYHLTVTSTSDSKHKKNSKHYIGQAFDCRIWGMSFDELLNVVMDAREQLGKDYDIVLEKDHIHVEYDPKWLKIF